PRCVLDRLGVGVGQHFGNRGIGQQQARATDLDQDAADILDGIVLAGCAHACLESQDGQRPASCSASSAGVATLAPRAIRALDAVASYQPSSAWPATISPAGT